MSRKLKCIMLIDDNKVDNFFHERVIRKNGAADEILIKESGAEALDYLKKGSEILQPELIFLDINMPGMDGWEFLEHYRNLDTNLQNAMIVVMLTTSENPDDKARATTQGMLADFKSKPLTKDMLEEVLEKFYRENRI